MFLLDFTKEDIKFLKELKEDRINIQYYLKTPGDRDEKKIQEFILQCQIMSNSITEDKIKSIRTKIKML